MKVLIWFGCFFTLSLVVTALRGSGIILGFVPTFLLYAAAALIARLLCLKIDADKIKNKAKKANMSEVDVVRKEIPSSLLSLCEDHRGNEAALKNLLDDCVKNGMINKAQETLLLEEYKKE